MPLNPYYSTNLGTLYHGDCLNIIPELEPVDLVLTDPPYGIGRDGGFEGFEGFGGFGEPIARNQYKGNKWDDKRPDKEFFDLIVTVRSVYIFGGNFFADLLPQSTHWIFWDKLNTMPTFGDGELIWTNSKRKSVKKITYQYNGLLGKEDKRYHPTQKPVGLVVLILEERSKSSDIVLDPMIGSGTTAIACERLNRRWIGIEISEEYCEIAAKRITKERQQLRLFD